MIDNSTPQGGTDDFKARELSSSISFDDIGGLKKVKEFLKKFIEPSIKYFTESGKVNIDAPRSILIYGPDGNGKTLLAEALCNESGAKQIQSDASKTVQILILEAAEDPPQILLKRVDYDSFDYLSQVIEVIDAFGVRGRVFVIAIYDTAEGTPKFEEEKITKSELFDIRIEIGLPSAEERFDILHILTKNVPLANDVSLAKLVDLTTDFSGSDLHDLVTIAGEKAISRAGKLQDIEGHNTAININMHDFSEALNEMTNEKKKTGITHEKPDVSWDDIGGLEKVKQELKEVIDISLKDQPAFKNVNIKPAKGVLMVGVSGTGKTMLAEAAATASGAHLISVTGPELMRKYAGETETLIKRLFEEARASAPSLVFIDEIDAIGHKRVEEEGYLWMNSIIDALLDGMDGLDKLENVVVVAATSVPEILDPALVRPGRFDLIIEVPLPDIDARKGIFKVYTEKMALVGNVDLLELSKLTEDYSGAEIKNICREAGMNAIRAKRKKVSREDFVAAIERTKLITDKERVDAIRKFKELVSIHK